MKLRALLYLTILGFVKSDLLPITCSTISKFIDGHNAMRLQLLHGEVKGQPTASEMKYMVWDEELAAKAAKWAARNKFEHNPDRTIASKRFTTGENIYSYRTTDLQETLDPTISLTSWWSEYKDYTYAPLTVSAFGSSKQIGHYTQMAWSNSTYVGCAISQVVKAYTKFNSFLVVCNYGPAGNFLGQTPYKSNGKKGDKLICGIKDCSQPYGKKCTKKVIRENVKDTIATSRTALNFS